MKFVLKYLNPSYWFSISVVIVLKRAPMEYCKTRPLGIGHAITEVNSKNVTDTQRFESSLYTSIYNKMLEHGDVGIFGYIDGNCACRMWGKVRPSDEQYYGIDLKMDKTSILVHYVETAKDYRRRGLARECLDEMVKRFQDRNIYVMVSIDNEASMKLHKGAGFEEVAVIKVRKFALKTSSYIHWIK